MAQGDIVFYNSAKSKFVAGDLDWDANTIKVTLHTGYTPDIDVHDFWNDVSATEYATASGYTAGGKTLASKTNTVDTVNNQADIDAADVTWTALGALSPATPSHAIIWQDTTVAATSALIAYVELGTTATNGSDYTIAWNAGGIFTVT